MSYEKLIEKYKNDPKVILTVSEIDTSTNDTALSNAEPGKISIAAAEMQTKGRGRSSRKFSSEKGGVYISFSGRADGDGARYLLLTPLVSLCVCEAIERICGIAADVKWPNDVLVSGKKVAGILCELSGKNGMGYYTVGVGVNADNHLPPELTYAASLKSITGHDVDIDALSLSLAESVTSLLSADVHEIERLKAIYTARCVNIGHTVSALSDGKRVCGTVVGISDIGGLILDVGGEKVEIISAGATLSPQDIDEQKRSV